MVFILLAKVATSSSHTTYWRTTSTVPMRLVLRRSTLRVRTATSKLYEHEASINEADDDGNSPLYYACRKDDTMDNVKFLCESGADVNQKNRKGVSPLSAACENGVVLVARILIEECRADETLA